MLGCYLAKIACLNYGHLHSNVLVPISYVFCGVFRGFKKTI